MFHRRRLKMLIIALLLATLPCVGLASFVREAQPACAMQMHAKSPHGPLTRAAHCKAMSHAAQSDCEKEGHCAMCDDLSTSLAMAPAPLRAHQVAASLHFEPADLLLSHRVASLWRPPRPL